MSTASLSSVAPHLGTIGDRRTAADVEIVIPVYNEAEQLSRNVTALRTYLDASFPLITTVTIVDNASTDLTWPIAVRLTDELSGVAAIHLDEKGRGRALRAAWSTSTAEVVAYMDVDLATGLDALLPLVAPLLSRHSDLAIGTRLAPGAHVVRGAGGKFISRGYNLLIRAALRSTCTDAQCGFKALRREAATELLPLVEDQEWFFDTEVLVTAQRRGLRIHEVPVDWVDDLDSRVDVVRTALTDLGGVWRMLGSRSPERPSVRPTRATPSSLVTKSPSGRAPAELSLVPPGAPPVGGGTAGPRGAVAAAGRPDHPTVFADELLRFAGVGVVSTLAYAALFAALEEGVGSYLASAVAIVLCSLGNTAAHRGLSGTARHGMDRPRRLGVGAALLGVSLGVTTAALATVHALGIDTLVPELMALTAANALAAVVRFAILRTWVFRPRFGYAPGLPSDFPPADAGPPPSHSTAGAGSPK